MSEAVVAETSRGADARSFVRRALDAVGVQNVSLLIALAVLVGSIGARDAGFLSAPNLVAIGTTITVAGLLAAVQTVVIILGALDISVGSIAGLTSVTCAMVFTASGSAWTGIGAAVLVGAIAGLVNGANIVYGRVNPVIATLATLAAYKGLAQLLSGGRAQGYTGGNDVFVFLARGRIVGVPTLLWMLVLVAAALHVLLKCTDIGRNIYAVGGNDIAARLAGISINRYVVSAYALSGVVAGIAGVLLTARTGSGQPVSGSEGLELESITAAALGGCALRGGKGSVPSTMLAVVLLGVLSNGMTVLGINSFSQNVAKGALLTVAVIIQKRRSGERAVGLPR